MSHQTEFARGVLKDDAGVRLSFPYTTLASGHLFVWMSEAGTIGLVEGEGIRKVCPSVLDEGWVFDQFLAADSCIVVRARRKERFQLDRLTLTFDVEGKLIDRWEEWDLYPDKGGRPGCRILDMGKCGEWLYNAIARFNLSRTLFRFDCKPDKGSFICADFQKWRVYWSLNHDGGVSSRKYWPGSRHGFYLPQSVDNVQLDRDGKGAYVATAGLGKTFTLNKISSGDNASIILCRHSRPFSGPYYEGDEAALVSALTTAASH